VVFGTKAVPRSPGDLRFPKPKVEGRLLSEPQLDQLDGAEGRNRDRFSGSRVTLSSRAQGSFRILAAQISMKNW
jgi:hypothetical protein